MSVRPKSKLLQLIVVASASLAVAGMAFVAAGIHVGINCAGAGCVG